ncbi:protein of unknown function [Paraburkholderia kururiensis]
MLVPVKPWHEQYVAQPGVQNRRAGEKAIGIALVDDQEADLITDTFLVCTHELPCLAHRVWRQICHPEGRQAPFPNVH